MPLILVAAGRFRQDLFYRLDVVELHLPPLVERKDDIPLLAFYFMRKHAARMGRTVDDIDPQALAILHDYDYPGTGKYHGEGGNPGARETIDRSRFTADLGLA
jgi:transcriptional regulator with PAS, ATPase and Fis domain